MNYRRFYCLISFYCLIQHCNKRGPIACDVLILLTWKSLNLWIPFFFCIHTGIQRLLYIPTKWLSRCTSSSTTSLMRADRNITSVGIRSIDLFVSRPITASWLVVILFSMFNLYQSLCCRSPIFLLPCLADFTRKFLIVSRTSAWLHTNQFKNL